MALTKCKECGAEISTKAAACPKCGAKAKKKTGCLAYCFLGIIILFLFAEVGRSLREGSGEVKNLSSEGSTSSPAPRKQSAFEARQEVKAYLDLEFSWKKAGFDNIMHADFTIANHSTHDVKDIQIRTQQYGPSGTLIDQNTRTIYEIIRAGEEKEFKDFNMGFIHSQSNTASATITDFVLLN